MRRVFTRYWVTTQSKRIYSIIGAWQASATPPNIMSGFKHVGIHVEWSDEQNALLVKVDPRTVPGCEHRGPKETP
jgi:hypothetical protein